jgi:hypothetical protein
MQKELSWRKRESASNFRTGRGCTIAYKWGMSKLHESSLRVARLRDVKNMEGKGEGRGGERRGTFCRVTDRRGRRLTEEDRESWNLGIARQSVGNSQTLHRFKSTSKLSNGTRSDSVKQRALSLAKIGGRGGAQPKKPHPDTPPRTRSLLAPLALSGDI